MIKAVRKSSYHAGGCNFCNVHATPNGETTHDVIEVSGDGNLYVRFCDACLDDLVRQAGLRSTSPQPKEPT